MGWIDGWMGGWVGGWVGDDLDDGDDVDDGEKTRVVDARVGTMEGGKSSAFRQSGQCGGTLGPSEGCPGIYASIWGLGVVSDAFIDIKSQQLTTAVGSTNNVEDATGVVEEGRDGDAR